MFDQKKASAFASAWVSAWNLHDLDHIMSHYTSDIEFNSPFISKLLEESSGIIRDKKTLRNYFGKALNTYPDLHFKLQKVFSGMNSVVLVYTSINNLHAAETMELNQEEKIKRVLAHYIL